MLRYVTLTGFTSIYVCWDGRSIGGMLRPFGGIVHSFDGAYVQLVVHAEEEKCNISDDYNPLGIWKFKPMSCLQLGFVHLSGDTSNGRMQIRPFAIRPNVYALL